MTSVERTLLDLAEAVPERLDRALEAAERLGLFDLRQIEALMDRSHGRRGLPILDAALRTYHDPGFTRSELERAFLRFCRDAGLPAPSTNVWIEDAACEVDVVWQEASVAVELDSRSFHSTRAAFERDRRRDAALQVAGYRVLRVTYRWLEGDPDAVGAAVRALLASSSSLTARSTSSPNSSRSAIAS